MFVLLLCFCYNLKMVSLTPIGQKFNKFYLVWKWFIEKMSILNYQFFVFDLSWNYCYGKCTVVVAMQWLFSQQKISEKQDILEFNFKSLFLLLSRVYYYCITVCYHCCYILSRGLKKGSGIIYLKNLGIIR